MACAAIPVNHSALFLLVKIIIFSLDFSSLAETNDNINRKGN